MLPAEIEQRVRQRSFLPDDPWCEHRMEVMTAVRQTTRIHPAGGEESLARRQQD